MFSYYMHRRQLLFASHFLVVLGAVISVGCQSAVHRRLPRQPYSRSGSVEQYSSTQVASLDSPTQSRSDSPQFQAANQVGAVPVAADEVNSVVLSDTDAAAMFRRLRGKLRIDDMGAVVEADLSYSDVTDEALASIIAFPEIRELDLTGTRVHDESLVILQQLPKLQSLKLKGTRISDVGITSLANISSLVLLDASNTDVTDEGFHQSAQWTNLEYLSLSNTSLTDASIPDLTRIKTLKGLSLLNSGVTAEGARSLKAALSDCLVVTNSETDIGPSSSLDPMRPVPAQSGTAFPLFAAAGDTQLEQLIELAGKQPQLAVHLALVYSNREQWPQAAEILASAVHADPNRQAVQLALGIALARSGDLEGARTFLTQSIGGAAANYHLGMIEYETNLRSCATHFREAVAADPSLTDAQTRLVEVQRELATLKQHRTPVRPVSSSSVISESEPMEVIPAPTVRTAASPDGWPR